MPAATSAAPLCEAGRNTITNSTTIKIGDDGDDGDGGDDGDDGNDGEDGGDSRPEMAGRRWQIRGRRSAVARRKLEVGDGRSEVAGLPLVNIITINTIIASIAYGLEIDHFRCKLLQMGPPWASPARATPPSPGWLSRPWALGAGPAPALINLIDLH